MTVRSEVLARSGAGSWIFVTALFPSVILFSKAIIWSVFYFYSTSTNTECTDNVEGYFFASIAAGTLVFRIRLDWNILFRTSHEQQHLTAHKKTSS